MTAYTVSVSTCSIIITPQHETFIGHLTTVLFKKISWWRGLRRGTVAAPTTE